MTLDSPLRTAHDPYAVAAEARSILACPSRLGLELDGAPVVEDQALTVSDDGGRPTFACDPGSDLVVAAGRHQVAHLRLSSGLGGSADPVDHLDLTGRLVRRGVEDCDCCERGHQVVVLEPAAVLLTLDGRRQQVPVGDFLSPAHALNRGYLRRAAEHATRCHGDDLRRAVARMTGTPVPRVLAASLAALTPSGVEVRWLDSEGGHTRRLRFGRTATRVEELGALLRTHLDGVC